MKKVFGIILIIVGFITILKYFFSHDDVVGYEIIGVIIGITIVTFLPAYFLMKSKKKVQDSNANKRLLKTTGIILIIIGALNIFRGVITLTSAPFEFQSQGVINLLMGLGFIFGGWHAFNQIKGGNQEIKVYNLNNRGHSSPQDSITIRELSQKFIHLIDNMSEQTSALDISAEIANTKYESFMLFSAIAMITIDLSGVTEENDRFVENNLIPDIHEHINKNYPALIENIDSLKDFNENKLAQFCDELLKGMPSRSFNLNYTYPNITSSFFKTPVQKEWEDFFGAETTKLRTFIPIWIASMKEPIQMLLTLLVNCKSDEKMAQEVRTIIPEEALIDTRMDDTIALDIEVEAPFIEEAPTLQVKYYTIINDKQEGPYNFEELKKLSIESDTLVWCLGMKEWSQAESIRELSSLFYGTPPPRPS